MRRLVTVAALLTATSSIAYAQNTLPQLNDSYFRAAQSALQERLRVTLNTNRAKNVILFVGDGMGISTVTAGRIYEGQKRSVDGESNSLTMEKLPFAALSKTYTHDAQVADSAPTAVAMVTGVKTRNDVIGVNSEVEVGDCAGSKGKEVLSLAAMAERAGQATGVVSTARITHATPASMYAHTPHRDWEGDANMTSEAIAAGCKDIAQQLASWSYGDGFDVIFGGGRDRFLPETMNDPEDTDKKGSRKDGRNLVQEWQNRYSNSGVFLWNKDQFDKLDTKTPHVMGLFERSHMRYEADRLKDNGGEPSLAEMTVKSIDILSQNPTGFFLMVEGGRIDHAHHDGNAYRSLEDMVAFDNAIKAALDKVNLAETLVIVTADHSHTLTISGYPKRGNPILETIVEPDGKPKLGKDGKPFTTLGYANGPGAVKENESRPTPANTTAPDYKQQSLVPLDSETHGGEDVAIFAGGPWAHLFAGVVEQNYIYHVIDHATKLGERSGLRAAAQ
jgi:alkaline phosphatase